MSLRPGEPAPEFELTDHTGTVHTSQSLRGRFVVIFFYPRDFSPVCTAQSCAFRDATPQLFALGAQVLGVSPDNAASHADFAHRHTLAYPLIADPDGSVARLFGVKRAGLGLLPGRETIVIDPRWRIALVYRALFLGKAHAEQALTAIRAAASQQVPPAPA